MKEPIGYIGLGIMGAPMARNLLKAGNKVVVHNRTRSKAEGLVADGAVWAETAKEVAENAKIIFACLADAKAVESVVAGQHGVLEAVGPGHIFVDMTTNRPDVSARLAKMLREKGAEMLDAPVSGGDVGAINGTLSIMVGGKGSVFERCLPFFNIMGKQITHMGGEVGDGCYAKLANQIMVAINLASMGEALVFGAKAGLDVEKLSRALSGGLANSEVLRVKLPKILSGNFSPGARMEIQLKDLDYIHLAMEKMGISLPTTELVRSLYGDLCKNGHSKEDHSAIIRAFEKLAGVEARGRQQG